MKTRLLRLGGLATALGASAMVFAGIATPEPAGACSCLGAFSSAELTEVRLLNPGERGAVEVGDLIATETAAWPQRGDLEHYGHFAGGVDDVEEYFIIGLEVE